MIKLSTSIPCLAFVLLAMDLDSAGLLVSYLFPASFVLLTTLFITIYVFDIRSLKFETLKQAIGIIETSVGTYVGVIFAKLFPQNQGSRN